MNPLSYVILFSICILPFMFLIIPMTVKRPSGHLLWFYGVICVLLSAMSAFFIVHKAPQLFESLHDLGLLSPDEYLKTKTELQVWLYIAPAVIAAIGANLITAFLTEEKNL